MDVVAPALPVQNHDLAATTVASRAPGQIQRRGPEQLEPVGNLESQRHLTGGNSVVGTITSSGLSRADFGAKPWHGDRERNGGRGPDSDGDGLCDDCEEVILRVGLCVPRQCAAARRDDNRRAHARRL